MATTRTYSPLIEYPYPVPTQKVELAPGNKVLHSELESMHFTVVKGERDFQPFEHVQLVDEDGTLRGVGQVTTYSHNRLSDITEINFLLLAFELGDGLFCLSAKEVTEEFIKTPEATTLMTTEHDEETV